MTALQKAAIKKHGRQLLAIFPNAQEQDPVKICKKLRRFEQQANQAAIDLCNIPNYQDKAEAIWAGVAAHVHNLLGHGGAPIEINRDPRGWALKISDEWMRKHDTRLYKDMGGYGILAPEFNAKGE